MELIIINEFIIWADTIHTSIWIFTADTKGFRVYGARSFRFELKTSSEMIKKNKWILYWKSKREKERECVSRSYMDCWVYGKSFIVFSRPHLVKAFKIYILIYVSPSEYCFYWNVIGYVAGMWQPVRIQFLNLKDA